MQAACLYGVRFESFGVPLMPSINVRFSLEHLLEHCIARRVMQELAILTCLYDNVNQKMNSHQNSKFIQTKYTTQKVLSYLQVGIPTHSIGTSMPWKSGLGRPLGSLARPPIIHYVMLKLSQMFFVPMKRR